jgi:outer membrane protein
VGRAEIKFMEKMMSLKLRPNRSARGRATKLSAACLAAFLAFGNAASVYGQDAPKPAQDGRGRTASAPAKIGEPFLVLEAGQTQTPAPRTPAPQTPTTQTPAQRDAQRPPGTERDRTTPPQVSPAPQSPTVPPGTQRPAPQAPPGTRDPQEVRPAAGATPQPTQDPTQDPASQSTPAPTASPEVNAAGEALPEPNFPELQARPVPPMPLLSRVGVTGGDTLPLSLNEAIRRALENNNDIEVARADVRLAEARLTGLRGIFDPVFTYTPQYNNSIRPVTNVFGGAGQSGTVSTTDINNDFSVTKQFGRGGGNYTYFFNNTREKTDASNLTLNPFYSAAQGISFTQPLWRNRAIDQNRQQIRIQQKRLEQSDADFRRRTIDVISQVQRAYWDLVFALRDEQNQIANLDLARENFRRTEASVAAGAVAPLQRAEVQTELSNREAALLLANQQVSVAENTLKSLLLRDPLAPEWTRALVPTDQPSFEDRPVELESALKEARANRQELRRLNLQQEINGIDIKYFKNQTKPRIDLTGTFQTNGLAGTPITTGGATGPLILGDAFAEINQSAFLLRQLNLTRQQVGLLPVTPPQVTQQGPTTPSNLVGGYGRTLRNLFSFDTRQVVIGATIQIPFKNRTAEANLAFAQIERDQLAALERAQEQVIEVEVRNAVQAVETARRRVLSARQARESAEEQLAGERRLYQVGRSTTFLLFQRENALVNARNQELRAETDYNKALAELQRATSTTLRANNVLIESPAGGGDDK